MNIDLSALYGQFLSVTSLSPEELSKLRTALVDTGHLRELPTATPMTLAATDGARLVDQRYTYDLVAAKGCAANAKANPQHPLPEEILGAHILPHSASAGRTSGTMMAAMELNILRACTHDLRIMDGSLTVPLIGLREGVYAAETNARDAAEKYIEELDALACLNDLYSPNKQRPVVAVAKSDSATTYAEAWLAGGHLQDMIRDRVLATLLLKPGEYLTPLPVMYRGIHVGRASHSGTGTKIDEAAQRLMDLSRDNYVHALYLKPPKSLTVLRLEYAHPDQEAIAGELAAVVASDTAAPHILEPYSQWQVDRFAKTLSAQPDIIIQRLAGMLKEDGRSEYTTLLKTRYRS